uniref:Uncharacterized protein n=2 Tax=Metallosphaera hakonensis TaxID=79601 RepID=A0A2U9ITS3_9CREN
MEIREIYGPFDKKMIGVDENCVTQVILNLPPTSVIRQACYFFFHNNEKIKIKDKSLYFLSLLFSTNQINEALKNSVPAGYSGKFYIIKCCKNDVFSDIIEIKSLDERISLSKNAILSL